MIMKHSNSGRPSMKDVAQHASVSMGTVSNVLNNPSVVTDSTRERVENAISELGFVRNDAARRLAVGRSHTVGFVVVDLGNSFFLDITRGIEAGLDEQSRQLVLANSDVDFDKPKPAPVAVRGVGSLTSSSSRRSTRRSMPRSPCAAAARPSCSSTGPARATPAAS